MSWDRMEYKEYAVCKCGKGRVVRHLYREDDDWNRTRYGCVSEEIECPKCSVNYYIEHFVRHYSCMPWDGDGISDRIFLVPNGSKLPTVKSERNFIFSKLDEQLVSQLTLTEIARAIEDMKMNKYSTRLEFDASKHIVALFEKQYKKRSLNLIIPMLEKIVQSYEQYEWTPEKIAEYRIMEKEEIEQNKKEIQEVLDRSFELLFLRNICNE